MTEFIKRLSEWLLLVYILVAFGLAFLDAPQATYMLGMFFGVGIGFMFSSSHYDSLWKNKYIERFERDDKK